jgi:hypothetical protein
MADETVKPWGEAWGTPWITTEGVHVTMRRRAQRVRFMDAQGQQHGPEHRNVVPAIIWANANGWIDPTVPAWLRDGMRREIAEQTVKPERFVYMHEPGCTRTSRRQRHCPLCIVATSSGE